MYLLVGSGNVAKHIQNYFSLEQIPLQTWSRKQNSKKDLEEKIDQSRVILLAISDSSLQNFYRQHLIEQGKTVAHFSGCFHFDGMVSAHPLMTFSSDNYDLQTYRSFPFAMTGMGKIQDLIPELKNPSFVIPANQKALYHSLCVTSGNFLQLLVILTKNEFSKNLDLPAEYLDPFLQQSLKNILRHPDSATGPLANKDATRVDLHLHALAHSPLLPIYQTFVKTFFPEHKGVPHEHP